MQELGQLSGKVALVIGSSSPVGIAIARELSHHGAALVLSDAQPGPSANLETELRASGEQSILVPFEATCEDFHARLLNIALDQFGGVDIVVDASNFFDTSISTQALQQFVDEMKPDGAVGRGGSIVFVVPVDDDATNDYVATCQSAMRPVAEQCVASGYGIRINLINAVAHGGGLQTLARDIAQTTVYLASEAAAKVSGQVLRIDSAVA